MSLTDAHRFVGQFSETVFAEHRPEHIWPAMLRMLQEAIGFDAGYIAASWGPSTQGRAAVVEHDGLFLKQNLGRWLAEFTPEEVARYTNRAQNFREVWSPDRRSELAVFSEVLQPTGMKEMLVRVSARMGNLAGFNLERRGLAPAFSSRDLMLVDMIAPFLHIAELLVLQHRNKASSDEFARRHQLTVRESELVELACRGLQNREIALLTRLSTNTVRNALGRVFEKVGASTRAELTYLAVSDTALVQASAERQRASSVPDDGTLAFSSRVEAASSGARDEPLIRASKVTPVITYAPPLEARVVQSVGQR